MKRLCDKHFEVGKACEIADKTGRTTTDAVFDFLLPVKRQARNG
jgi:hypothetical protein